MRVTQSGHLGRILFGIPNLCFALQTLLYAAHISPVSPAAPLPATPNFAATLIAAVILLIAGVAMVAGRNPRLAGYFVAAVFFLYAALLFLPPLVKNIHDPGPWTSGAELIGLAGAGLYLAAGINRQTLAAGRNLFAASLVVFAVQHFLYAQYVATLIPRWIPAHLFFAYFTGAAFIATALAIALRRKSQPANQLLGAMFLIWFLVLHIPRVAATPISGDEWTSAFVCLAFSGAAFVLSAREPY